MHGGVTVVVVVGDGIAEGAQDARGLHRGALVVDALAILPVRGLMWRVWTGPKEGAAKVAKTAVSGDGGGDAFAATRPALMSWWEASLRLVRGIPGTSTRKGEDEFLFHRGDRHIYDSFRRPPGPLTVVRVSPREDAGGRSSERFVRPGTGSREASHD
jgi:hypothetical protein